MDLSSQEKGRLNAQNISQNQVLNCPVTISVALENLLGSLREQSYQLFDVLSLVSVHNRMKSLKPLSMPRIQDTRLHRALFFEEGDIQNGAIHTPEHLLRASTEHLVLAPSAICRQAQARASVRMQSVRAHVMPYHIIILQSKNVSFCHPYMN